MINIFPQHSCFVWDRCRSEVYEVNCWFVRTIINLFRIGRSTINLGMWILCSYFCDCVKFYSINGLIIYQSQWHYNALWFRRTSKTCNKALKLHSNYVAETQVEATLVPLKKKKKELRQPWSRRNKNTITI